MPPFFTIITATYNAAGTLPRLLDSLASQTCRDFNWIVQDGASSDTTMQIVDAYTEKLPSVLAESVTDKGIYDAWNKALEREKANLGTWILFLGADDFLADPGVLGKVKSVLEKISGEIILAVGSIECFSEEGNTTLAPSNIVQNFEKRNLGMPLPHTGLFAKKELFERCPFDPQFKIAGDYDWLLSVWQKPEQSKILNVLVTKMALGGISNDLRTAALVRAEDRAVWRRHPPRLLRIWPIFLYIYLESLLHPIKIRIKTLTQTLPWTAALWLRLHQWRKSNIDKCTHNK